MRSRIVRLLGVPLSAVCALVLVGVGPSMAEPGRGTTAVTKCPDSAGSSGNGGSVWGAGYGSRLNLQVIAPASAPLLPSRSTKLVCTQFGYAAVFGNDVTTLLEFADGLSVVVNIHTRSVSGGYVNKTSIGCSDKGWISGHGARVTWPVSTYSTSSFDMFNCSSPDRTNNARFSVDWTVTPPNGSDYYGWTMTLRRSS